MPRAALIERRRQDTERARDRSGIWPQGGQIGADSPVFAQQKCAHNFNGRFNRRFPRSLALVLAVLAAGPGFSSQERLPKPEDFAGTLELTGQGGGLLALELPEQVYRGVLRPDLADIRVFDAQGLPLPFVLRSPPEQVLTPPPEEVPFFIWEGENAPAGAADIEIDASGAVLRIRGAPVPAENSSPVYLLDLSRLSRPPLSLAVDMGRERFFNTTVNLKSSSDLSRWTSFEKPQILAWYGEGGAARDSLELPSGARYLLLQFGRAGLAPRRVEARFGEERLPPETRSRVIAGEMAGNRRSVSYDLGGLYPLRSLEWRLTEIDSLGVLVSRRLYPGDPWSDFSREELYRIGGEGGERRSPALELDGKDGARYWRLLAGGDLAFAAPPELTIRWTPRELVFLGRGEGPWTLAYGSGDWGEGPLPFLPETDRAERARLTGRERYTPAPQQEETPRAGPAWSVVALWTILGVSVIILTGLAVYIARAMGKKEGV